MSWQQPLTAGFNRDVRSTPADTFDAAKTSPCQYSNNLFIFTFHLPSDVKSEILTSFVLGYIISIATFSSHCYSLNTWFNNILHFSCHKAINVILWSQPSGYIWHIWQGLLSLQGLTTFPTTNCYKLFYFLHLCKRLAHFSAILM